MDKQKLYYIEKYYKYKQCLVGIVLVIIASILSYYGAVIRETGMPEITTVQYIQNDSFWVILDQSESVKTLQWQFPYLVKIGVTTILVQIIVIAILFISYNILSKGCFEGAFASLNLPQEEIDALYLEVVHTKRDEHLKKLSKKDDIIFGGLLVFIFFLILGIQIQVYGQVVATNFERVQQFTKDEKFAIVGVELSELEDGTYYAYAIDKTYVINLAREQGLITYPRTATICNELFTLAEDTPTKLTYTRKK